MGASSPAKLSLAFSQRELNGEVLLAEVGALRRQGVHPAAVQKLAVALAQAARTGPLDANALRKVADRQAEGAPLASLLTRYADKVRHPADGPALVTHFHRLAQAAGLLAVIRAEALGDLDGEAP
jgi:hypothetical protein